MVKHLLVSASALAILAAAAVHAEAPALPDREAAAIATPGLVLAQALLLEDENPRTMLRDHPAIVGVLRNRKQLPALAELSLAQIAVRYCAGFVSRNPTPRQVRIRSYTWEQIPTVTKQLVEKALAGEDVADPCRGRAWHFGNPQDARRHRGERLDCGLTANVFIGLPLPPAPPYPTGTGTIPARIARGHR